MSAIDWIYVRKMQAAGVTDQRIADILDIPLVHVRERLEATRLVEMQVVLEGV